MAFWDDLGKKASAATSKAMQKAQDLSETAKLNSMISDEERRVNAAYIQIGKLYVEIHREDGEEAFSELLGEIRDAEKKISSCREQIQNMKRTLRCEKCGAEVPRDSAFCSVCGSQIVQEKEPTDTTRCEKCGAPVTDWMRFCTTCGNPLPQPVNIEETGVESADSPYPEATDAAGETPAVPEEDAEPLVAEMTSPDDVKAAVIELEITGETGEGTIQPLEEPAADACEEQPEAALPGIPQTMKRVCPHCGAEVDEVQLFCIECGNSL